jgi:hypothetical protein
MMEVRFSGSKFQCRELSPQQYDLLAFAPPQADSFVLSEQSEEDVAATNRHASLPYLSKPSSHPIFFLEKKLFRAQNTISMRKDLEQKSAQKFVSAQCLWNPS